MAGGTPPAIPPGALRLSGVLSCGVSLPAFVLSPAFFLAVKARAGLWCSSGVRCPVKGVVPFSGVRGGLGRAGRSFPFLRSVGLFRSLSLLGFVCVGSADSEICSAGPSP